MSINWIKIMLSFKVAFCIKEWSVNVNSFLYKTVICMIWSYRIMMCSKQNASQIGD